ncbi:MAG: hypothetical protein JWO26_535 [Rhodospirillales bacterium]|nr:hypothetical protein [Rhodospirillales bacterium]
MPNMPDLGETRRFLRMLDPAPRAVFDFRTAADRDRDPRLSIMMRGTLGAGLRQSKNPEKNGKPCRPAGLLTFMQEPERYAGVFAVISQTNGEGQTDANVTDIRMVFSDEDSAQSVEAVNDFERRSGLTRTIVVQSGGVHDGVPKTHSYWRLSGCPVDQFRTVQHLLCSRIGGDRAVVNPSRVMRLPGYWHLKGEPRMTRIVAASDASYKFADFVARVRAHPELHRPNAARSFGRTTVGRSTALGANVSPQAVEFRKVLEQFGGLITPAVRAAIAKAQHGERHLVLRNVAARLVLVPWPDADIRALVLPAASSAWPDVDPAELSQRLDSLLAWVRAQEAAKHAAAPAPLGAAAHPARAFGAGQ